MNVTHPHNKAYVFSKIYKNNTWITDIGASYHMTRDSSKLESVRFFSQSIISITNGSISPITRERSIILPDTLIFNSLLVI